MIEASELSVLLADKAPVLLECCWGSARKYQLYKQDHIPHAQFLDLKVLSGSDHVLGGTHITRPNDAKQLSEFLGQLGIRSTSEPIVVYSRLYPPEPRSAGAAVRWSTRAWWTLFSWGFTNVKVLNGVYEAVWQGVSGMPVESGVGASRSPCQFAIESLIDHKELRATTEEVVALAAANDNQVALLDVLDNWPNTGQKYGRPGHIKGAVSTPYLDLVDAKTGRFMDVSAFLSYISERTNISKPCVAYCHGGISATVLLFLMEHAGLGGAHRRLYDDSMFVYTHTDPQQERPFEDMAPGKLAPVY